MAVGGVPISAMRKGNICRHQKTVESAEIRHKTHGWCQTVWREPEGRDKNMTKQWLLMTVGVSSVVKGRLSGTLCGFFLYMQVKADLFSTTTSWLGYVRCKACLVHGHMRKLLISAVMLQCTSAARRLALVLGVIKPLQQCRTDVSHSLDLCFFVLAVEALLPALRRHPGPPVWFPTCARAVSQVTTAIIQQCCNCLCSNHFPTLMSDAIKAETSQRYSGPHCSHMKMISSMFGSRVLRDCMSPFSPPPQTLVIATTFSHRAAVCLSPQVWTSS